MHTTFPNCQVKNVSTITACGYVPDSPQRLIMQKIFSKTEVAALLKLSPRYIEMLVARGLFPKPAYLGDHPVWRETELSEFIEKSLSPGKKVSAKK